MIIVMRPGASAREKAHLEERIQAAGLAPHAIVGTERTVYGAVGDERAVTAEYFETIPGVESVHPILARYKLASRELRAEPTIVPLGTAALGGAGVAVIAGPCTVESRGQLLETAHAVREAGAVALRGGAFKPRTSPYDFQGLAHEGLLLLAEAREATGLPIVTEVLTPTDVEMVETYADVLQIGARNMQNYPLLRAVGNTRKPVLLKRGPSATLDELLLAGEYVLRQGNPNVLLCERGIRTFETHTRNTLALAAVPSLKEKTHLPVVIDPSHGTGKRSLVTPMALAAVAAGADALIVEVHIDPERALVDGSQSLDPAGFAALMQRLGPVAAAVGRTVARP